ncbi:hypothetical protein KQI13_13520, partial [Anaerostipes hadrus]|nr:hypothetical protein [Anaerostipes hadrus]
MKKKGNFRKVVSGLLAGMTMLSTVLSPMTAYAAEIQPEEKPPLYEEVKDLAIVDVATPSVSILSSLGLATFRLSASIPKVIYFVFT